MDVNQLIQEAKEALQQHAIDVKQALATRAAKKVAKALKKAKKLAKRGEDHIPVIEVPCAPGKWYEDILENHELYAPCVDAIELLGLRHSWDIKRSELRRDRVRLCICLT